MSRTVMIRGLLLLLIVGSAAVAAERKRTVSDWPSWRGPNRDGISHETGLLREWPEGGPPLAWRIDGLGKGYSSLAVAGGRLFTMGHRDRNCLLIALDTADGRELWATPVGGGDPNCTPTVDGDRVYALARDGELLCARSDTGEEVWRKSFRRDFGGRMMSGWGYSESLLVDGDRLICTPGADDAMIVALDKQTGEVVWKAALPEDVGKLQSNGNVASKNGAGYASVVISQAAGVRQYVQLVGHGVISVDAQDGRFLWAYPRVANTTANIPTPVVTGDYVFCSSGYGDGGAALLKVVRDGRDVQAEEVYYFPAREVQNHHGGMVLVGDHVYFGHGHSNGFPLCLELASGEAAWRPGRGPGNGSAAVLYADGHLYFRYQNGTMALIEANPEEYVLKSTFDIPSNNSHHWPHPVIADGRLYLRDQGALLCYDIKQ